MLFLHFYLSHSTGVLYLKFLLLTTDHCLSHMPHCADIMSERWPLFRTADLLLQPLICIWTSGLCLPWLGPLSKLAPGVGFLPTMPADLPCFRFSGQEQGDGCLGRGQSNWDQQRGGTGGLYRGDRDPGHLWPPLHREAPGRLLLWREAVGKGASACLPQLPWWYHQTLPSSEGLSSSSASALRAGAGVPSPFCRASLLWGLVWWCGAERSSEALLPCLKLLTSPCVSFPGCETGMMLVPSALSCSGDAMS